MNHFEELHTNKFCAESDMFKLVLCILTNWHLCKDILTRTVSYHCQNNNIENVSICENILENTHEIDT